MGPIFKTKKHLHRELRRNCLRLPSLGVALTPKTDLVKIMELILAIAVGIPKVAQKMPRTLRVALRRVAFAVFSLPECFSENRGHFQESVLVVKEPMPMGEKTCSLPRCRKTQGGTFAHESAPRV